MLCTGHSGCCVENRLGWGMGVPEGKPGLGGFCNCPGERRGWPGDGGGNRAGECIQVAGYTMGWGGCHSLGEMGITNPT